MSINGCDCYLVIKTGERETVVPYSEETIRENIVLLREEAAIEGVGEEGALRKSNGTTGCVVTPLTMSTAPLLLCLAMGYAERLEYVSETRDLYCSMLQLLPFEDSDFFDIVQDRGTERKLCERCRVESFELRIHRNEALKLKLDISGAYPPAPYPYGDSFHHISEERFNGDCVTYTINGASYTTLYGCLITVKKRGGTKTDVWLYRSLEQAQDIPPLIDELTITARLQRDKYERRHYGMFQLTLTRLLLVSDETRIDAADTVVGPLRYYAAGTVKAEVFTNDTGSLP